MDDDTRDRKSILTELRDELRINRRQLQKVVDRLAEAGPYFNRDEMREQYIRGHETLSRYLAEEIRLTERLS